MVGIAIVGAGALGTYAMERLAALALHGMLDASAVDVRIFERTGRFGDGEVYDVGQPKTNLLNTSAGELALGADNTVEQAKSRLLPGWNNSFLDWCHRRFRETGDTIYDVEAGDAPPRAVYGEALKGVLGSHVDLLRKIGATVSLIPAEVTAIEPAGHRSFNISAELDGRTCLFRADEILLVTGHARRPDAPAGGGKSYAANPYPINLSCSCSVVPPGSHVGIRGMGLSAIDLILALTEGRGGGFEPDETSSRRGALRYLPCGREPAKIVATSRGGLFTRARSWLGAGNTRLRTRAWFFTPEAVDRLRRTADGTAAGGKIDANRGLMPLIVLEMAALFHAVAAGDISKCPFSVGGGVSRLYEDLLNGRSVEIDALVDQANAEAGSHASFRPEFFFDPLAYFGGTAADQTAVLIRLIEVDNAQALLGANRSPHKAAAEGVWRDLRSVFSYAVDQGGLTPTSHRDFVEKLYRYHNHLSNGASLAVMEKVLALLRAGVLDVSVSRDPTWSHDAKSGQWVAVGAGDAMRRVDHLIEASIPTIGQAHCASQLHRQMFQSGILQRFKNTLGLETYVPGGVATDGSFHPLGAASPWREAMTVLGAQLDGAVFFQPSAAKVNCNDGNLNKVAAWTNGVAARAGRKTEAVS
ncbi:FAD/NAD(P)-binding protein [Gluconacetobacter sacchari]|nr:FAD/NAD(P)-binding protein [Gluconacetobacter sacchari]